MTTDDQGKEKNPQERLDEIKREEKEDASSYYSQGSSKDNVNEEAELSKPVPPVKQEYEEMNMLKAISFLGFGMAALSIIFILFFVRDLDTRVIGMDGTLSSLEEKIVPLKKHVDDSLSKVNEDIIGLKNKVGNYERMMAVTELKRALVTFQEIFMGNSSKIKAKSREVVTGIEVLLTELGAVPSTTQGMPAGIVSLEEAPVAAEEPHETTEAAYEPEVTESAPEPEVTESAPEPEVTESAPELEVTESSPESEVTESAPEPEVTESAPEPVEASVEESSDDGEEGGDEEEEEDDDE
jgi:hypothetical protein